MSTPEAAPVASTTPGGPAQPIPLWRVAALTVAMMVIFVGSFVYIDSLIDRAWDKRAETLSEKYGTTIQIVDRPRAPRGGVTDVITWRIDGVDRECSLTTKTDVLRCEDEMGALVEVGQ